MTIVNADDFGYSKTVNEAICTCFEQGLINRTTIMVNMPESENAVKLAFEKGFDRCVGLHINLTEGRALTEECRKSALCDENGYFKGEFHVPFKSRIYLKRDIVRAIACEVEAQIKKYIDMGFSLMHADSHNYTHSYLSVYMPVRKLLKKYGFKSVRISRNIPENDMSPVFKVYKTMINFMIKHLKVNGKTINTTEYFGSFQDFDQLTDKAPYADDIEFMTHPDIIEGVLTDNTLPNPHPFRTREFFDKSGINVPKADNRIKLLVAFLHVHVGGAMTSVINFLNCLDTTKYDVDVVFYEYYGDRCGIKEDINILPQGKTHESLSLSNIVKKTLSPSYMIAKIREQYYKKIKKNTKTAVQIMSAQGCRYSRKNTKKYDIAVAYEFFWPMNYVMNHIDADKKIIWHHLEYSTSGLNFNIDKKAMNDADALVFVSSDCMKSYCAHHPEHKDKTCFIPNILSNGYVRAKGEKELEFPFDEEDNSFRILSVARIDFEHKGFDRGVRVFEKLKNDGLLKGVKWIIVGDGDDLPALKEMISQKGLDEHIITAGLELNPIPYMKKCHMFLLPSLFEGKPMVVTESFIMGLVPVVTEYTSAKEQIKSGYDGLVFENSEEGLYEGLKDLLKNRDILTELKKNVDASDYGNEYEIKIFDELADKLMNK